MRHAILWLALAVSALAIPAPVLAGVDEGDRPSFSATTLDGIKLELKSFRGKVVLVDFWATWCAPCARSFPFYAELLDKYGDDGFVVVAVSEDEDQSEIERFVKKHPAPFSIVLDKGHTLAAKFAPPSMPTAYLIDRSGKVRLVHHGYSDDDRQGIERWVEKLLEAE